MGKEIERKYLVKDNEWKNLAKGTSYRQGYLSTVKERTVRVRTIDEKGFLTIKGITVGASRAEYEYEIPAADANAMLNNLCEKPLIEKNRYKIAHAGLTWEVDEFFGDNDGLVVAEVELTSEDQKIDLPAWIGSEVTSDTRYFNSNLTKNPYKNWK
ncbi:MAG: adenylate cyclase [Candidatus Riflebacteria bacterium HGW-Riflebacteria-2]|jgi:CYTH domain-containing protein|nr:MAG: adenylate cyclase [Candidatus Riflebacteria bacterium HGW-Riflebacteria-2]